MLRFPSRRWCLACVLASLVLMAVVTSAPAWASGGYGELLRFSGEGTAAKGSPKGKAFELAGEEAHAFGVDPTSNDVYVGDEGKEEFSEELRLQQYSQNGEFKAAVTLKPGALPTGISGIDAFEGIAVDPKEHRVYALVSYKRSGEDVLDPSKEVAGALYAFSTTPEGEKLVPAEGTGKGGLVGTTTTLLANSTTSGQALLEPAGIAIDPLTDEVMILGEVDGNHAALDRVSKAGVLGTPYVDPEVSGSTPDSPVVSPAGKVFFENSDEILQVPANFSSSNAPKVAFQFAEPGGFKTGPFREELVSFGGNEAFSGGGLAIVHEEGEAEGEGKFVADASVQEVKEHGEFGVTASNAEVTLKYVEGSGEKVTVSELGWTGGQPGESPTKESCAIGFGGLSASSFQVAAGKGGAIFVLAPSTAQVVEFGEGGSHCPAAKAVGGGLQASVNGEKVSTVNTTEPVTLSVQVQQASVLGVTWKFGDGQETTTSALSGEQTQTAEIEHTFVKSGKLTVEAIIHTDDLATPEIKVSTSLTVEPPPGGPKVTTQPTSQTVIEGHAATFKAAASGAPTITVQWQESHDKGVTWKNVGAGTSGGTAGELTVLSVTTSESGYEYEAVFKNSVGEATSNAATLTVESQAQHEAKEKKEKEEEEAAAKLAKEKKEKAEAAQHAKELKEREEAEARAKARAEEEARAKAQQEAEAAKKAQEEAAAKNAEGTPRAALAGTSVSAGSSGAVSLKVSCPGGVKTCTGTVTLRTLSAVSANASARAAKKSILTLAIGSFTITGGQTKTITLHLSAKARALLVRSHLLRVRATIVAHNAAGASSTVLSVITLHAPKGKSHH
jgi:hypothetical protein